MCKTWEVTEEVGKHFFRISGRLPDLKEEQTTKRKKVLWAKCSEYESMNGLGLKTMGTIGQLI